MNEQVKELAGKALDQAVPQTWTTLTAYDLTKFTEVFAELIVRECCLALWTEECHSSDLAFDEVKRNATRIKEHFGIDPNEVTEDMLARSIKWMEQQLADRKKHFGVDK
jgi:hypothetical protein